MQMLIETFPPRLQENKETHPVVSVENPNRHTSPLGKTLSRRLAGQQLLHHFWTIIPQHIRARPPLYNPVGGSFAATHKQTPMPNPPPRPPGPPQKALGCRICEPPFLCSQFVELEPTASWATAFAPGETNPCDYEAQYSDSQTVEHLFVLKYAHQLRLGTPGRLFTFSFLYVCVCIYI